jgi:hypothetical protein
VKPITGLGERRGRRGYWAMELENQGKPESRNLAQSREILKKFSQESQYLSRLNVSTVQI